MRIGKNGMAAVMDAMLFIVVMMLAVSALFAYADRDEAGFDIERMQRDLFGMEVRVSDVFDVKDSRIMPLADILAIRMMSEEGTVDELIFEVLRSMVPVSHGFVLECTYAGVTFNIGNGTGIPVAACVKEMQVMGGGSMTAYLKIF